MFLPPLLSSPLLFPASSLPLPSLFPPSLSTPTPLLSNIQRQPEALRGTLAHRPDHRMPVWRRGGPSPLSYSNGGQRDGASGLCKGAGRQRGRGEQRGERRPRRRRETSLGQAGGVGEMGLSFLKSRRMRILPFHFCQVNRQASNSRPDCPFSCSPTFVADEGRHVATG